MLVSKSISLGVAALTALFVAMGLAYYQYTQASPLELDYLKLTLMALGAGASAALLVAVLMNRLDAELRRLCAYVDNLGRPGSSGSSFQSHLGMHDLTEAVLRATQRLRNRVDQLSAQHRELEIHARLSDFQHRHNEAVLNAFNDAVIVVNAAQEIALANRAAGDLFGFCQREARQRSMDQVVNCQPLIRLVRQRRQVSDNSDETLARRRQEFRFDPDGSGRMRVFDALATDLQPLNQANASTAKSSTGEMVVVIREITRDKEAAEQKSEFVSRVSHELRTPLSSIRAYMEMLIDGEASDDDTRREFYSIIQGETNRLSRLIDNLLCISRIESGVVKVQRELVSLPQIVRDVLDVMQPQARAKEIELVGDAAPRYVQVFADRDMIYQALLNLVNNAVKYTPAQGRVDIMIEVQSDLRRVNVHVADTGVGVPVEEIPHVFEKFYRVRQHKIMAQGTGLGLNLVKQIIERVHAGTVCVKSNNKQGSTFTFSLPIAEDDY